MSSQYMSKRRKFLTTAGALVSGSLAGCAGSNAGDNETEAGSGTVTGSARQESVNIEFWHIFGGSNGEHIDSVIDDFTADRDNVNITTSISGGYQENLNKVMSAINAGNAPEISMISASAMKTAIDSGEFIPMDELLGDRVDYSNLIDATTSYFQFDGSFYSHPFNNSSAMLYYNKDMFDEAQLDPESPPTTFQGVKEASQAIVENTDAEEGMTWANDTFFLRHWFSLQNQLFYNNRNGRNGNPTKIHLLSDASKNTYNWWNDLHKSDLYLNVGVREFQASTQAFVTQRTGMLVTSSASVGAVADSAKKNGFELGTGVMPSHGSDRTGVIIGGGSLYAARDAFDSRRAREVTADFMARFSQPDVQAEWHKETGYFPIHKDAVSVLEEENWFNDNPNFRTAFTQLQNSKQTAATQGPLVGPIVEIGRTVNNGFVKMAQGESVQSALESTKREADNLLQEYKEQNE